MSHIIVLKRQNAKTSDWLARKCVSLFGDAEVDDMVHASLLNDNKPKSDSTEIARWQSWVGVTSMRLRRCSSTAVRVP